MINNTINPKIKTYNEIFIDLLTRAYQQGLISDDTHFLEYIENGVDIENMYILTLSNYSQEYEQEYNALKSIINSNDIDKATGSDLEILGNLLGIPRPTGTHPLVTVTFSIIATTDNNIIIPANTILTSTEQDVLYYTLEEVSIPKGQLSVNTTAQAQHIGHTDSVNPNTITLIQSTLNTKLKVSVNNTTASTGGTEPDDDNTYRLRLKRWSTTLKRGTKDAYEYYLQNVDGLEGYRLLPNWDGTGTVKVIVDPNTQYMVDTIANDLFQDVQSFDDDVIVEGVTPITISVTCNVNITLDETYTLSDTEKQDLQDKIRMAIEYYIDGGTYNNLTYTGLQIGEDFIPWKCSLFINNFLSTVITDPNKRHIQDISFKPTIKNDTDSLSPVVLPDYIPIEDEQIATLQSGYSVNLDETLTPVQSGTINITIN